jgi:hypothetical protein
VNIVAASSIHCVGQKVPVMPHKSFDDRLADIERELGLEKRELQRLQTDTKPIVDFYNAGTKLGKLLWVAGGIIVGVATVWAAISGWVTSHWK